MNQNIRFFIYAWGEDGGADVVECSEQTFLDHPGVITYERHTVRENGVSQVCLTVEPGCDYPQADEVQL
jgi:hypothetical protein